MKNELRVVVLVLIVTAAMPALGYQCNKLRFTHAPRSDWTVDYEIRDDKGQFCDNPGDFTRSGTAAPGESFEIRCDGSNTGLFCMRTRIHGRQAEFGNWTGGYMCGHCTPSNHDVGEYVY